jgi:uncharacterized damage-inducible protein DinB
MSQNEQEQFLQSWDWESQRTAEQLRALPKDKYDFRPDPQGRSIGEMAWHLAEIEAYMTTGVGAGKFDFSAKLPGLERPRKIEELAPGYERVHRESVDRVKKLKPEDWNREIQFMPGQPTMQTRMILWGAVLHHLIHHRAQLMLMSRLAGGTVPGIYGPNREDMAKMMEAAKARG